MIARLVTVAALLAASSTIASAAEPVKAPAPATTPGVSHPVDVELASADHLRTASPANAAAVPIAKKPRAMRVTTCRCGGQAPEPSNEPERR